MTHSGPADFSALFSLGLSSFFLQQLSAEEREQGKLARVVEVQRSQVTANDGINEWIIPLGGNWYQLPAEQRPTIGDWVLLDAKREKVLRLLERKSVFRRVAAGPKVDLQLIAANVDTLFIVTSCNEEFNESRLERYLALAYEVDVYPVVVMTKTDMAEDAESYRRRVQAMKPDLVVELVNALDVEDVQKLASWVSKGSTVALVGSSGVGKSTLVNSLSGQKLTETSGIREKDAKGHHTTSYRALYPLSSGGVLLDVPGMREVKVAHLSTSLAEVFDDIEAIAQHCKFRNCAHVEEPGCAVRAALEAGELDPRRLKNYQKLILEEARNTSSLSEQRHRDRQFSKMVRRHVKAKKGQQRS
ncbi:ribosome small subunit-dependent GTPase A [Kordiimonas sp. SCSIO 12603]|uniref:ribosome small subunit-dependent GTPase A n=1 Tax=Kordiimonas sp. SCSIO 12603 TaxID=2829596 RepID=UPI00210295A1|nr:ribosome small subunit-dependent GTPase A [Kordiimonas sp. SCSIO 12603]UTW58828.1 ribosome small subunit-dependent GTPase A [Kordiimonas sp. SCSIO 12603]